MTRAGTFVFRNFVGGTLILALSLSASAGAIALNPAPAVSGPGLGFASIAAVTTPTPNNDNVPRVGVPDNNIVIPFKRFDFNDYIDIQFTVLPTDGVTEYHVSEFVDNNTGSNWTSYTMLLGFGTGSQFVQSPFNDALDFDSPDFDAPPSSGSFGLVALGTDKLTFFNGTQGGGAQPYQFRVDVPDLQSPTTFTLRQIPQPIPEPSTVALLMLAITGICCRRNK